MNSLPASLPGDDNTPNALAIRVGRYAPHPYSSIGFFWEGLSANYDA
jgi:hypothetical protein